MTTVRTNRSERTSSSGGIHMRQAAQRPCAIASTRDFRRLIRSETACDESLSHRS